MKKTVRNYLRLLRPRQWSKNFAIFAAITFGGQLFIPEAFLTATFGFFIFCSLSSAIYVINDIFDINKDRLHPFKRFRPLANNDIPIPTAIIIAIILSTAAIIGSTFISPAFFPPYPCLFSAANTLFCTPQKYCSYRYFSACRRIYLTCLCGRILKRLSYFCLVTPHYYFTVSLLSYRKKAT